MVEFHGGAVAVKGIEVDGEEFVFVAENGCEVGVGLLGVIEVELDEIRAVDEGAPWLGDAPVAQEILYRQSAQNVDDYLPWKLLLRHCM